MAKDKKVAAEEAGDEAILGKDGPSKGAPKFKKGLPNPVEQHRTVAGHTPTTEEQKKNTQDMINAIKERRRKQAEAASKKPKG